MAGISDIEWTDATWNPVSGCTIISPGCSNCYAMRMAGRLQAMNHPAYLGITRKSGRRSVWTGVVRTNRSALDVPLKWRTPKKIFVNSMSDLFQDSVEGNFIRDIWRVMEKAHWHKFQILTKRPERMAAVLLSNDFPLLQNVWLGTSVEAGPYKDRIKSLQQTPAAIRFVSFEPLIGPTGPLDLTDVHWAIVGGESGPSARPMEQLWVDEIRDACATQSVAFFFKQWGGVNKKAAGRKYAGRTWDDFPEVSERPAHLG